MYKIPQRNKKTFWIYFQVAVVHTRNIQSFQEMFQRWLFFGVLTAKFGKWGYFIPRRLPLLEGITQTGCFSAVLRVKVYHHINYKFSTLLCIKATVFDIWYLNSKLNNILTLHFVSWSLESWFDIFWPFWLLSNSYLARSAFQILSAYYVPFSDVVLYPLTCFFHYVLA